jgi:DNA-binding NtrC family response regulator
MAPSIIDTAIEATRMGAQDFLEKPIALQKLLTAIKRALLRPPLITQPVGNIGTINPAIDTTNGKKLAFTPFSQTPILQHSNGTAHPSITPTFSLDLPLREARETFERIYFEHHLRLENGSITRLAEKTGLERTHLYRKLKQLGIHANGRQKEE